MEMFLPGIYPTYAIEVFHNGMSVRYYVLYRTQYNLLFRTVSRIDRWSKPPDPAIDVADHPTRNP